jgi:hypothetical protein
MALPVRPPYPPMEALLVAEIPSGKGWQYEPKWTGFRCLAFKEQSQIELQSKNEQSLGRYFPELISAMTEIEADQFAGAPTDRRSGNRSSLNSSWRSSTITLREIDSGTAANFCAGVPASHRRPVRWHR